MRIGHYELGPEIARGGMGVVFRAHDTRLKRDVAIKMITASLTNERARARFDQEIQALARLRHPNIVGIHYADEHEGSPFLVMDLVEGETLHQRLERGLLPIAEAVRITEQVARALEHAHQASVLHRDIKPANILLDTRRGQAEPRLTDFGLAKDLQVDLGISRDGTMLGSPGYLPPEQAFGKSSLGPAADVYSLGATLYACLTGEPPIRGDSVSEIAVATQTIRAKPPSERRPEVDAQLDAICLRCLAKDPTQRYGSARELADALADWLVEAELEPLFPRPALAVLLCVVIVTLGVGLGIFIAQEEPTGPAAATASVTPTPTASAPSPSPEPSPPPSPERIKSLLEQATQATRQRRRKHAIAHYTTLLELVPDHLTALKGRALLRFAAGNLRGAEADASNYLNRVKSDAGAYNTRGLVRAGVSRHADAIADYDRAIALNPKQPQFHINRGLSNHKLERFNQAVQDASRAIKLAPRSALAFNNRGLAYAHMGQRQRAMRNFTRAIQLNPKLARAYLNRGQLWASMKRLQRAINNWNVVIQLAPKSDMAQKAREWRAMAQATQQQRRRGLRRRRPRPRKTQKEGAKTRD